MQEIACANCGKKIPTIGKVCPYCGVDKTEQVKQFRALANISLIIAVACGGVAISAGSSTIAICLAAIAGGLCSAVIGGVILSVMRNR